MATASARRPRAWPITALAERFGPMPVQRIRQDPPPGSATEEDVLAIYQREKRLYELVDGILVEKAMGFGESCVAGILIQLIRNFLRKTKLGTVTAPDGMIRLAPGLIRIPDVSFISWNRLPNRRIPKEPIPSLAPNLAIEVLSEGNTEKEMSRKLHDYFSAGIDVVWFVDPKPRTVRVYSDPETFKEYHQNETLDGGSVLPGFKLRLKNLFAELDEQH